MTWEQKEQVLRLLFAKMNGSSSSTPQPRATRPPPIPAASFSSKPALPPITEPSDNSDKPQESPPVFLTQSSHHGGGPDFKSVLLRQSVSWHDIKCASQNCFCVSLYLMTLVAAVMWFWLSKVQFKIPRNWAFCIDLWDSFDSLGYYNVGLLPKLHATLG